MIAVLHDIFGRPLVSFCETSGVLNGPPDGWDASDREALWWTGEVTK